LAPTIVARKRQPELERGRRRQVSFRPELPDHCQLAWQVVMRWHHSFGTNKQIAWFLFYVLSLKRFPLPQTFAERWHLAC
jgi:hypothetical protein